jgi:chromosome segregation ATPase
VTIPKCDFVCSVITGRGTVIACSKSESIYHLFAGRHHSRVSEERIPFSSVLFVSPTCLIMGDTLGGVAVVPFPFVVPVEQQSQFDNIPELEFSEGQDYSRNRHELVNIPFVSSEVFRSHCGRVTSLCTSLDGKVLFTAAADSSICVFNVLGANQTYASSNVPILRCDTPQQQFFLVSQSKFDELQHSIEKLKREIHRQRVDYEAKTIESLQAHQKNMQQLTEQHEEKKARLTHQIETLKHAMDDSTVKAALIYENMEAAHFNEAKALTNLYEQKLALECAKCDQIAKELEDLKCSYEERIYLLRQQYKTSLQEFTEKVDREQTMLTQAYEATKGRIQDSQDVQDHQLTDLEVEFDHDWMQVNLEYHNKLTALDRQLRELNDKKARLKADTQRQEAEITELKGELNRLKEKRSELDKELKAQQHTLDCRTSELNDRDETLLRQAERLDRLQSSNSELEKNRTIMDYRLHEMKQELQPSNDEITRLEGEKKGNTDEIETIQRSAEASHHTMHHKAQQKELLKKRLEESRAMLLKKKRIIQMFTIDVTEGVGREDSASKAGCLRELYEKYVATPNLEKTLKNANETIEDHTRQRKHLQQSVMLLQRQLHQQQEITAKHFAAKSAQCSLLLSDFNRLQKENWMLRKRLDNAQSDAEMLESNLKKARQAPGQQQSHETRFTQSPGRKESREMRLTRSPGHQPSHETRFTQSPGYQQSQKVRVAKTALAGPRQHRVVTDWVKEKSSMTGTTATVSVIDGRGKWVKRAGP